MRRAVQFGLAVTLALTVAIALPTPPGAPANEAAATTDGHLPPGSSAVGRYFVKIDSPSVGDLILSGAPSAPQLVALTQVPAATQVRSLGGDVVFSYTRVMNAFSATMTPADAALIARRADVASVEPVGVMERANSSSVPFIGARKVWRRYGVNGQGMKVAVVDTGIDYTHKDFGGEGTVAAFQRNDPNKIERGTFPTKKVIDGYDFVGTRYDVLDFSTLNDIPRPDPDPLDDHGHGSHVAGSCCGNGVPGKIGRGVAFKARILAYKVWGQGGSSSADVLVAAYERAVDPNEDGNLRDAPDVLSFSGGVPYGTPTALESEAAQRVVDLGIVFVAGAGNAGHQTTDGSAYVLGAPASAPGVIAVGATSDPDDAIANFSSEGPARGSHALKPDITAPGVDIKSAEVGTGDGGALNSGTSMATPHVSGVAALLLQIHPEWTPDQVKAAMMNHAKPTVFEDLRDNVPATVKGAGRVRAPLAARAVSFAIPASLSFGLEEATDPITTAAQTFTLSNDDKRSHVYEVKPQTGYSDYDAEVVQVEMSVDGAPFVPRTIFRMAGGGSKEIAVRLNIDPAPISEAEETLRFYEFLPGVDGAIEIRQSDNGKDTLRVPWHVIPLAASDNAASDDSLDLTGGTAEVSFPNAAAGTSAAELFVLGATDASGGEFGEEDAVVMGARSFTGETLGDGPVGLPAQPDALRGRQWIEALERGGPLEEPVEFVIGTALPHETLRTMSIYIYIDKGADGIYSDDVSESDGFLHKELGRFDVCFVPDVADGGCETVSRPSFHQYDSNLIGIIVDAQTLGLTESKSRFAYRATVCTDRFTGDVLQPECDDIGFSERGDYAAEFDPLRPALTFSRNFCGDFWSFTSCSDPITIGRGFNYRAEEVLAVFPNNSRGAQFAIIDTTLAPTPSPSGSGSESPSPSPSGATSASPSNPP